MTETVYDRLRASATRWPDRSLLCVLPETAAAYDIPDGEISFADALAQVDALAAAYAATGYTAGHRVLILLENRPSYFLHWIALNRLGASAVPVNPDLRAAELAYMIGHCEPAGAVAVPSRGKDLSDAASYDLPVFGPDDTPLPPAQSPNAAEGEAAMLYTSGTTGNPKGCVLRNEYFTMSGDWYKNAGGLCAITEDGERMLTPLPVFHMNAMACSFMAMLTVGGCLIALDRFHPKTWWASVRDSRATCLHYLGVIPSILMKTPEDPSDRDHSIKFGFGAGVDPELHAPFEERFGFPLVEGWGMTETSAANTITNNREPRLVGVSCLGLPPDDIEVRVVDEAGQDVPADAPGELLVRRSGDQPRLAFFDHYYKNPEATAEAWEGGWFHTGDLVRRDAEGRVFFVDRKKNIIRRSGENIAAVEVESVLMQHPAIKAAAVAPVADEIRGEEVFALIVTDTPGEEMVQGIMTFSLDQMAYYKAPGHIAFVDELPLTSTQKIQRGALKAQVADLVEDHATHHTAHLKKRQG
ncbi:MAG: AMP-binding protein [Paracoccaceae bacterium]